VGGAACWWVLRLAGGPAAAAAVAVTATLARILWVGEYRVRSFEARCPACAGDLRLTRGARIRIPHALRCRGCGRTSEVRPPARPPARPETLRHLLPDCIGAWGAVWLRDEPLLSCRACGALQPATPVLRRLASAENERGEILARLTREGRFLRP
jgi:hypothetical protein